MNISLFFLYTTKCTFKTNHLTCRSQHGAGEEQRRHKVPVVLGVVSQHGHSVVAGLQCSDQQLLQTRVGHTGVVGQEVPPGRLQLQPQLLLVGKLDGGEYPGSDQEVKDVTDDQERKIQGWLVPLRKQSAPFRTAERHHCTLMIWFEDRNSFQLLSVLC